jgi:hypothetical protein
VNQLGKKQYYIIDGKISEGRKHSGYRKRIYQDASLFGALYDVRNRDHSIWYPEGSDDLHISLMFENSKDAHKFINNLINYNLGITVLKGRVSASKQDLPIEIESNVPVLYVHTDEYVFEASDSPANTWDDIKSTSEVPFVVGDPIQERRSLENLALIPKGDVLYKCHIAPQAFYPDAKNKTNNIIFGSHLFHHYFDGDGKRRPDGADVSWGTPPQLKIEYFATGPDHLYEGVRYYMIRVVLTFNDPEIARIMEGRWREGTTVINDFQFLGYFFTTNVEECKSYLDFKTLETEKRWSMEDVLC